MFKFNNTDMLKFRYAPIQGNELFNKLSEEFVFGANSPVIAVIISFCAQVYKHIYDH